MLQVRPTFSESWYRVAPLRAKLRASAQISRQFYRGERWYVVRDPAGNQFHRLSDAAYRFVGLLDGTRTVLEAWELVGGQLADDAPTQPEVIHILSQLHSANLLEADITPDSAVLLRRHKQMQKQKMQGRLMNILFPRIPLWDPDRFLKTWLPLARVILSKMGAIIWLAVVIAAVVMVYPKDQADWGKIKYATTHSIDVQSNPLNLIYLYGMFVLIKLIHELGHAFACRRFGGEVHELGIMFLVLIPAPYVDASTAWAFPSKWQRIFVGCGGMISELFFAALMAFVWLHTNQGEVINQLAYNAMLIASVSTVIFNANPLLRYDGYYILSDFLEIPNLRQKSVEYTMGLIKRHIFRVKQSQPLPPPMQRFWLFVYCIASSIYRVFVGVLIILVVTTQVPVLGILMALGGVATWLLVPVWKVFKYLALEPELHRKRGRATAFVLAVAAAVFFIIGMIPFWVDFEAQGILEPVNRQVLHLPQEGQVEQIQAVDGQMLKKGEVILVCSNDELARDILTNAAQLEAVENHLMLARSSDQNAVKTD
ncbi:MAG TPA: site-2 protease family protein, partial [Tepidisphaeraceae bacterium]